MSAITLEMFLGARKDYELSQYHILSGLQKVRREFSQNRIYPPLSDLIELIRTLRTITQGSQGIRSELPRRVIGFDMKTQRVLYEPMELDDDTLAAIEELINWALPRIQTAIEEGQTIFNFVDEHLELAEVGLLPSYTEEGYLLIPELKGRALHVVRYEVSILSGPDQNYRNLKTWTVRTLPMDDLGLTPARVKHDLIEQFQELPNPATYIVSTELDFPFAETILPVAKRKFIRRMYS